MIFNSFSFAIFLPIVFLVYWFGTNRKVRIQNVLLLIASYFFYACWDWRFLILLIFSTTLDYYTGIKIYESDNKKHKSKWLWLSLLVNLGILGIFKYYDFFATSLAQSLQYIGLNTHGTSLEIILPVGISFYTFHGLSYILDLYNNKIKPEHNFINYSLFVGFFPLLVAGPIERATHLLPQIVKKREFDSSNAVDGLRQILWGLFKKMVIGDNCGEFANTTFNHSDQYSGSTLILGTFFFAIQIYSDFSGYSDIAIGTSRLFGISLIKNFAYPYFSRDVAEFWRRWHISLSSWFKDYLYIPLGGSKGNLWIKLRNTFIVFTTSAFWHGANWTYIIWGMINALFMVPSIVFNKQRLHIDTIAKGRILPSAKETLAMMLTFGLISFSWIFFRASSLPHAFSIISQIASSSILTIPYFPGIGKALPIVILLIMSFGTEWIGRENPHALSQIKMVTSKPMRWTIYYAIVLLIYNFSGPEQQFIYFQF